MSNSSMPIRHWSLVIRHSSLLIRHSSFVIPPVGPVGIEPTSSGLRNRCITLSATVPLQSTCVQHPPTPLPCYARTAGASGPGGARIPVSWASTRRYAVSATGPSLSGFNEKSPRVAVTPGFGGRPGWWPSVTSAGDARAARSPNNRQNRPGISVRLCNLTTRKTSFLILYQRPG